MSDKPAQRQDSLTAQLRDLIPIANQHGMYDAADFLKRTVEQEEAREKKAKEPQGRPRERQ